MKIEKLFMWIGGESSEKINISFIKGKKGKNKLKYLWVLLDLEYLFLSHRH